MYGHPQLTTLGIERVSSIGNLVEAIKRRQMMKPSGRFSMLLGNREFAVNLLQSGHLEIDGKVPSMAIEREFEEAIASIGAQLDDVVEG